MNVLKFMYRSRGAANLVKRAGQVVTRFGPGPGRMGRRFDRFIDLLDEYECRPSFPITALPMQRHPKLTRHLIERGVELAVHAFTHSDLAAMDFEGQSANIGKAVHIFRKLGIPFCGFRAPYLHWNEDTMKVVETYQFRYSSNQAVLWNVLDVENMAARPRNGFEKGMEFYRPWIAEESIVLPFKRRGFVEIPVSLPDDEILLDRMYFHDPDVLASVWEKILERTYRRGELFTVQLHPERIDFFRNSLGGLLADAKRKKPGVWIATMSEIAQWWNDKSQNSADFRGMEGKVRANIKACRGAKIYIREEGMERTVEPGELEISGSKRPCVGVSAGSDRIAIQTLRDKGYIVEVGEDPDEFALHVGMISGKNNEQVRKVLDDLEELHGPLLRFGTWPYGNQSALAVTGDIDALTLWDFIHRLRGA